MNYEPSPLIVTRSLDTHEAIAFATRPFRHAVEVSGLFSGRLDLLANKHDLDFSVTLYEAGADGRYTALAYCMQRASYADDRTRRRPLSPERRRSIAFSSGRLMSHRFAAGSRLVAVLGIFKERDVQLNYGTGRDVGAESIGDATSPLHLRWYADSYLDVPASVDAM